ARKSHAVAQLAVIVFAHYPQAAVGLQKQTMVASSSNRRDAAGEDPLRRAGAGDCAITQLPVSVVPHRPQAPVRLEKEAMVTSHSSGNRRDAAGHDLLRHMAVRRRAIAQSA